MGTGTVWTVKGGRSGEREDRLLKHGLIGGGWEPLPSLEAVTSKDALAAIYAEAYPSAGIKTRANYVGQLWSLVHRMQDGDLVVLPLKTRGTIAVGQVQGPYQFRMDLGEDLRHCRPVKWIAEDIPRDAFDQDLLYSFGAFLTFGRVKRENAEKRILAALKGKRLRPEVETDEASADEPEAVDIGAYAKEQIRQFVSQNFAGHDLAELVGHILRTSDFSLVEVSPPGADGGVDILAGCGPLGMDSPRVAVQVKTGQAGVEEYRALLGVMKGFGANQGLLVAWRGFRGTVREEARGQFFDVRLWDADDLLDALYGAYESLPDEVRSHLPLKRVWALVPMGEV